MVVGGLDAPPALKLPDVRPGGGVHGELHLRAVRVVRGEGPPEAGATGQVLDAEPVLVGL